MIHAVRGCVPCLLLLGILLDIVGGAAQAESGVDFNRDVRPILSDKCFHCHGPDAHERKGDLRLDVEEAAKADRGGYRVLVPGEPEESELILRITSEEQEFLMPPPSSGKELAPEEIETLRRWIEQGAQWSQHWAYVAPKRHPTPPVRNENWPLGWIDRFILSRLEAEGLEPSPIADRVTLLRRLSFDLTGLPPTPQQVEAFLNDARPGAYERLVDRFLATPAYGERMAAYWLDLVRYADTVGYHGDQDHNISPYRDRVIEAFNDNMPFDRFTREQLAGDLLPDAGVDQKIASGYNRLLQTSHEGGVQAKEYLAIYAADRVRNFSSVWMGATLGCAQCHDHKYDPYTMKDFYSMQAFFADVDEAQHLSKGADRIPTVRPPERKVLTRRERAEVAACEKEIAELEREIDAIAAGDESSAESALREKLQSLQARRDAMQENARLTMITVAIEPRTIRLLPRGNWLDESGPVMRPEVPEFLPPLRVEDRRATRLDLANWLTDAEIGVGGLTARVFVNRSWYLLFGVGLAADLDDFGGQGEAPVHPELLDNLAVEFVESGWDRKHFMKLLVMSRAYRQASLAPEHLRKRDPNNRLLARQSRFRLPAEMVRDAALAISGLLVTEFGDASVKPYQPSGYYRHLNFPKRTYEHHTDRRQWRRGVYVHWQRQFLHPMLMAFDAPSREECTAQRPRSNTPLAALVLLNDPTFIEAARVFATRILVEGGETVAARIEFAYCHAVSRRPDDREHKLLRELFASSLGEFEADPKSARALISTGQMPVAEEVDPVELAAWTTVARALLNLNETITRN